MGPVGLFLGYDFNRQKLDQYPQSADSPPLAPSVALNYSDLVAKYPVRRWKGLECGGESDWDLSRGWGVVAYYATIVLEQGTHPHSNQKK
jgi:hypothetical protein